MLSIFLDGSLDIVCPPIEEINLDFVKVRLLNTPDKKEMEEFISKQTIFARMKSK